MVAGSRVSRTTPPASGSLPAAAPVFERSRLNWSMSACATWLPDSRSVLVHARPDPALEADWWIVPMDGGSPTNTGVVQRFREAGLFTVPTGAAWVDDSLVFYGGRAPRASVSIDSESRRRRSSRRVRRSG